MSSQGEELIISLSLAHSLLLSRGALLLITSFQVKVGKEPFKNVLILQECQILTHTQ